MEMITVYAIYMTVAMLVVGLWAVRVPREDVKIVFTLALIWPASILALLAILVLNATDWDMDMAKGEKMFGFRKPTNPQIRGFAFTVLKQEFQFFSKRRKTQAEIDAEIDRLHK